MCALRAPAASAPATAQPLSFPVYRRDPAPIAFPSSGGRIRSPLIVPARAPDGKSLERCPCSHATEFVEQGGFRAGPQIVGKFLPKHVDAVAQIVQLPQYIRARYGKSFQRDRVEGAFAAMLETLTPTKRLFDLASAMFKSAWDQRRAQATAMVRSCEKETQRIEREITVLLDRIIEAQSNTVIAAYEKRITALEKEKLLVAERAAKSGQPRGRFEELFELAMCFLASPSKIWETGKIESRKLVLRLTFADRLPYCPKTGFRTPKTTLPFKVLGSFGGGEMKMARPKSLG